MSDSQLAIISGFRVEQPGVGKIEWEDDVYLCGVNIDSAITVDFHGIEVHASGLNHSAVEIVLLDLTKGVTQFRVKHFSRHDIIFQKNFYVDIKEVDDLLPYTPMRFDPVVRCASGTESSLG